MFDKNKLCVTINCFFQYFSLRNSPEHSIHRKRRLNRANIKYFYTNPMFIESINKKGKTLVLISNNVSIDALINLKCFIQLVMI